MIRKLNSNQALWIPKMIQKLADWTYFINPHGCRGNDMDFFFNHGSLSMSNQPETKNLWKQFFEICRAKPLKLAHSAMLYWMDKLEFTDWSWVHRMFFLDFSASTARLLDTFSMYDSKPYTAIHIHTSPNTALHSLTEPYTAIHSHTQPYTAIHSHIQPNTVLHSQT